MDNITDLDKRVFSSSFLEKISELALANGMSRTRLIRIKALVRSCRISPRRILQALAFERERERRAQDSSSRPTAEIPKIRILYVTHEGDFRLFLNSLQSLEALRSCHIGDVYVLEDSSKPLSFRNKELLRLNSSNDIQFIRSRFPLADRGPGLVASELLAFKEIGLKSAKNDYIAKVDSDTLFVSDRAFSAVLTSGADILGEREECWSPLVYVQGGCYFLRSGMVPKLFACPILPVLRRIARSTWNLTITTVPEDAVINELVVTSHGNPLFLDNLYCPWWRTLTSGDISGTVAHLRKATTSEYTAFHQVIQAKPALQ